MYCSSVPSVPGLWQIVAETNGYLLVRGERSLLIDCPVSALAPVLLDYALPLPDIILHTQVQEEHCREWVSLPEARVGVARAGAEVARCSPAFFAACQTTWSPSREWDTRGEEPYGIAGCMTERSPREPLHVTELLEPGSQFCWEGCTFEVLALPGSGKYAIGLYWREHDILFSGDLIVAGGYLANLYDLERGYGIRTGYEQLRASLHAVIDLHPTLLLPTTGEIITEPVAACRALQQRLDALDALPTRRGTETPATTNYAPIREFGRYREVTEGIYQCTNFGNIVLYVDKCGRGCLVDPDPCIWLSWEENCREMHADLDLLERKTGLRSIDLALITHYHGDHLEYGDLLRERYGATIATTPDVAAVMARPEEFRYPCTIDWYDLPFDRVQVDRVLAYGETINWGDTTITPMHLPGHCFAHAGYAIPWRGLRTICTGDTLQYGAGPISAELPILYNDTAWPDRGALIALRALARMQPQLVLGGHGHSFFDRDGAILRDWLAVQEAAIPIVAAVLADGDLLRGMTPPGYDAKRPTGDSTQNGSAHEAHARSRVFIGSSNAYRDDRP